jgi:hypothetical protein
MWARVPSNYRHERKEGSVPDEASFVSLGNVPVHEQFRERIEWILFLHSILFDSNPLP